VGVGRPGPEAQDHRVAREPPVERLPGFGKRALAIVPRETLRHVEQGVHHAAPASRPRLSSVPTHARAASAPFTRKWAWKKPWWTSCSWKWCGGSTTENTGVS